MRILFSVPFLFMFWKLSPGLGFQKFQPNIWGLRKGVASLVCVHLGTDRFGIVIVRLFRLILLPFFHISEYPKVRLF